MKANFNRGIEQGISAEDLVDPNSSNYIFTNQDFYIPTVEQVNAEIRNSINKSMGIPEREFKPEQIRVPVFDISNNTVTYFDDREKSTITLRGDDINPTTGKPNFKYKDLKDFKMNDPKFLNWLPGQEKILIHNESKELVQKKIDDATLIFTLDFNTLSRIDKLGEIVSKAKATKVMIDHHEAPEDYASLMYSDTHMSSTCEMIYNLIISLNPDSIIVLIEYSKGVSVGK